jgi:hypothetical protein
VEDDELKYLLDSEESIIGRRQYFSWDTILPSRGEPFEQTVSPSTAISPKFNGPLLGSLLGPVIERQQLLSPNQANDQNRDFHLDDSSQSEEKKDVDPLGQDDFLEDNLIVFAPDHFDDDLSEDDSEPDWLELAGEAGEFEADIASEFDAIEVEGAVGRANRALQVAMELGNTFNLSRQEVQAIAVIFDENGWSACKKAICRELDLGTTVAQLELAAAIKEIWLEHYEFYSGQATNYRIISWKTALKLANSFSGYPVPDEVAQLLVHLHHHWRTDNIQHRMSYSFNEYLIAYLDRVIEGFEYAPEWAIELEAPSYDDPFLPPSSADIPAIPDYELERALRTIRLRDKTIF